MVAEQVTTAPRDLPSATERLAAQMITREPVALAIHRRSDGAAKTTPPINKASDANDKTTLDKTTNEIVDK